MHFPLVLALAIAAAVPPMTTASAAQLSVAQRIAALPPAARAQVLDQLNQSEQLQVAFLWEAWARQNQLEPAGNWSTWLVKAGRGYGKTRVGAEWVRKRVEIGKARRVALIGATAADVRDTMVEGDSGLLAVSPPWFRPKYEPSKRRVTWPNGAMATCFSADEPNRLRGPQHDTGWADELAAWQYPEEAWDNYQFGLRLGADPRSIVTTTPRPIKLVKALIADKTTHVTHGSTFENRANLAPKFLAQIVSKYEGTRLGRQELNAELLEDNPGALWKREWFDARRIAAKPAALKRVVVAVDPAMTSKPESDETGVIAAGVAPCDCRGKTEDHGFVFDDASGIYSPDEWARLVVHKYQSHEADHVTAEVNNGGDLVVSNIKTAGQNIPVHAVRASRGKAIRAEPVSALYEQGKVHHVGSLAKLEDQCCDWNPATDSDSPDRLDALVWAMTDLMLGGAQPTFEGLSLPRTTRRM
jgi:predicted phage terminase large subunit-like protein